MRWRSSVLRLPSGLKLPDGWQAPTWGVAPPFDWSAGPQVAKVCASLGYTPDPLQEFLLTVKFAFDGKRRAATTMVVICGRQNLKTAFEEMGLVGSQLVLVQSEIVHTAHEYPTARETFEHILQLYDAEAWSRRRIYQVRSTNGREAITMRDPRTGRTSRIRFRTRTPRGMRGLKAGDVDVDEAFALTDQHMGSLKPIQATFTDPQVTAGSSACWASSIVLRRWRDIIHSDNPPEHFAGFDWGDDPTVGPECGLGSDCLHLPGSPDCRLDDRERIRHANPLAGIRLPWENIMAERRDMSPTEFARERLGWHEDPVDDAAPAFSADGWLEAEHRDSQIVDDPIFALSVAPSRKTACIGVAGFDQDGHVHLEVTSADERTYDYRPGTSWVLGRLKEIGEHFPGARVCILRGSAAEAFAPALTLAGWQVQIIPTMELPTACAWLSDQVDARQVAHIGQTPLVEAVNVTVRREVADRGFQWGSRRSGGDITPTMAVTLAAWPLAAEDATYDPLSGLV